jgi:hypothetical protein
VGARRALGGVRAGEGGAEGCAEFGLHGLVGGEEFEAPEECGGGGVVTRDEEAEDLGDWCKRAIL